MDPIWSMDHQPTYKETRRVVRVPAGPFTSLQLPVIINHEEYRAVIDVGLPTSLVSTAIWQKVNSALYPLVENYITERVTRRTNLQLMGFTHFQLQVEDTVLDLEDALVYDFEEPEVFLGISAVAALGLVIDFQEGTFGLRSEEGKRVNWNDETVLYHDRGLALVKNESWDRNRFDSNVPPGVSNMMGQMPGGMMQFSPSSLGPLPIGMTGQMGPGPMGILHMGQQMGPGPMGQQMGPGPMNTRMDPGPMNTRMDPGPMNIQMDTRPRGMIGQRFATSRASTGRNIQAYLRRTAATTSVKGRQRPNQTPDRQAGGFRKQFPPTSRSTNSSHSEPRQKVSDGKVNFFLKKREVAPVQENTPFFKKKPKKKKKNVNVHALPILPPYKGTLDSNYVKTNVIQNAIRGGLAKTTPFPNNQNNTPKSGSNQKSESSASKTQNAVNKPKAVALNKSSPKQTQRSEGQSKGFTDGSWVAKPPTSRNKPLPKNYKCGNCFAMDHTINNCKKPIELKCVFCGQSGHLRIHCPTVIKTAGPAQNVSPALIVTPGAPSTPGV